MDNLLRGGMTILTVWVWPLREMEEPRQMFCIGLFPIEKVQRQNKDSTRGLSKETEISNSSVSTRMKTYFLKIVMIYDDLSLQMGGVSLKKRQDHQAGTFLQIELSRYSWLNDFSSLFWQTNPISN